MALLVALALLVVQKGKAGGIEVTVSAQQDTVAFLLGLIGFVLLVGYLWLLKEDWDSHRAAAREAAEATATQHGADEDKQAEVEFAEDGIFVPTDPEPGTVTDTPPAEPPAGRYRCYQVVPSIAVLALLGVTAGHLL